MVNLRPEPALRRLTIGRRNALRGKAPRRRDRAAGRARAVLDCCRDGPGLAPYGGVHGRLAAASLLGVRRAAAGPCAPPRGPAVGPVRHAEMPWPAHGPVVPGAAGWPGLASGVAGPWRPGWQDGSTPGSPPFCSPF